MSGPSARRYARVLLAVARVGAVLVVLFFIGLEIAVSAGDFDLSLLEARPEQSLAVSDRDGSLLSDRANAQGLRHRWVALDGIAPSLVAATIAVEDSRFYEHQGVDWRGVGRAAWKNLRSGAIRSGASTVTMQLTRMLKPHPRKSFVAKLVETVNALRLERAVPKSIILEHYLNRSPYGAGTVGIEAASWRYFSKSSRNLTLSEATLLAGLPGAPSRFNPLKHYERALARRAQVLRRMLAERAIDAAQFARLQQHRPALRPQRNPGRAAHLVDALSNSGRRGSVQSALDGTLQSVLEAIVADRAVDLSVAGAPHAAVIVLDNKRCDVLAMVGSPDYRATRAGAVNGAVALRQPGSTLKPFAYALAFMDGAHEGTVVPDVPTRYGGPGGVLYSPRNYDRRYSGPVSMGEALARSLNVPAMVTAERVGLARFWQLLQGLGFDSLDKAPEHYGLGLVLGNGEVRLVELAQAYAALARGGLSCRARLTRSDPDLSELVMAPSAAAQVTHILADDYVRAEAFGLRSALMLDVPVAVKTGTSANWRDSWSIGYTRDHTVAVWVGDFANRSTQQLTGSTGAGPLFRQVAQTVLERFGTPRPLVDPGVDGRLGRHEVCALSGERASEHCPHRRSVKTSGGDHHQQGHVACTWHRPIRVERTSGLLAGPACADAQVEQRVATYLPSEYAEWQALEEVPGPPTRYAATCPGDGTVVDAVKVTWPRSKDVFVVDPSSPRSRQSLLLRAAVEPRSREATWYVNGEAVGTVRWPYELVWPLDRGQHTLQLVAGARRSDLVAFSVR